MKHRYPLRRWKIDGPHYTDTSGGGEYPYWQFHGLRIDNEGMASICAHRYKNDNTSVSVLFIKGGKKIYWCGENKNRAKTQKAWARGVKRAAYNMLMKMREEIRNEKLKGG